jgi:hypothetical protein
MMLAHPSALSVLRGAMGKRVALVALILTGVRFRKGWGLLPLQCIISSSVLGGVCVVEYGFIPAAA